MHGRRFNGKWKNFKQEIFLYEKNISFFLETLITHNNKEVLKFLLKITNSNAAVLSGIHTDQQKNVYTHLCNICEYGRKFIRQESINAKLIVSRSSKSGSATKDNRRKSWLNTKRGHERRDTRPTKLKSSRFV